MKLVLCASVLAVFACQASFAADFSLSSASLKEGGVMPLDHVFNGCGGRNISPDLQWQNAPAGTKSFAITAYDPDAPTGSGWWHWLLVNMPASSNSLPANAGDPASNLMPEGVQQGIPDGAAPKPGYFGACPPKGDKPHRYVFSVIALSTDKINIVPTATPASTAFQINKYAVGRASMTVSFGR